MKSEAAHPSIFDSTLAELTAWCEQKEIRPFVAKQIWKWLWGKQVLDPSAYSDLAPQVREALKNDFDWTLPIVQNQLHSKDEAVKSLLRLRDGACIECVLMPNPDRVTLCISSQVGCKLGCDFCQTGAMGFVRNLTQGEILSQVLLANRALENRRVTNVVFMGMGEPLDNFEAVQQSCRILLDPNGFELSRHRVTISTAGIVPAIYRMAQEFPLRLAVSLHTADDAKRSQLMPINRKYPLKELKQALLEYPAGRDGITFEYAMIDHFNDSITDAKLLVKMAHGLKARVNLIPLNHVDGAKWKPSSPERIAEFQRHLSARGIPAPIRYSRGDDIAAACGQLVTSRGINPST